MQNVKVEKILKTESQKKEAQMKGKTPLAKKWLLVGLLIAFLNPVFAGLVLGAAFLSEPSLKREGWIVTAAALIWGLLILYFYKKHGLEILQ